MLAAILWVDHGPGPRRIDAFGQTDRCLVRIWHDSLPKGAILVHLALWVLLLGALAWTPGLSAYLYSCVSACIPHFACNHGLRHRRLELLINLPIPGANSGGGRATLSRKVVVASQASTIEVASGFHSVQCSPNLPPKV